MARKPWSFKEDRRLMELAKSSITLEQAAKQLGRSPEAIKRMALRLGLALKSRMARKRRSGPALPTAAIRPKAGAEFPIGGAALPQYRCKQIEATDQEPPGDEIPA